MSGTKKNITSQFSFKLLYKGFYYEKQLCSPYSPRYVFYKFNKLETDFENSFLRQDPSRQSLRTFGSSESVGSQGSRRPYSRYGWILGFKVSLLRV